MGEAGLLLPLSVSLKRLLKFTEMGETIYKSYFFIQKPRRTRRTLELKLNKLSKFGQ